MNWKNLAGGGILLLLGLSIGTWKSLSIRKLVSEITIKSVDSTITVSSASLHAKTFSSDSWTCSGKTCSSKMPNDDQTLYFKKNGAVVATLSVNPGWSMHVDSHNVDINYDRAGGTVNIRAKGLDSWIVDTPQHVHHSRNDAFTQAAVTLPTASSPVQIKFDCQDQEDCIVCWGARCQ